MRVKTIIQLFLCFTASLLLVILLYYRSQYVASSKNSFTRLFPPHILGRVREINLGFNSFYIAGTTGTDIYLANYTAPSVLLKINYQSLDSQTLYLHFPDSIKMDWKAIENHTEYPSIYVFDPNSGMILTTTLHELSLQLIHKEKENSNQFLAISDYSYLARVYNRSLKRNVLVKKFFRSEQEISFPEILEKQVDGFFCVDGMVHYDKTSNAIVYIYFYRNQFMKLDTNLHLSYRSKTLDTFSHAHIKIADIKSDHSSMLSAPPVVVNRKSTVSGGMIFINSFVASENETHETFSSNCVIDVYSLDKGNYKYSFYLPKFLNKAFSDFRVNGKYLIALYDQRLVLFELNL